MIVFGIGFAIGIWTGVIASRAAYRNGVIDGARNRWLPRVKRILEKTS